MNIPNKEQCIQILRENKVPDNIIAHSKKVYEVAVKICDILEKKGIEVDRDVVGAAALLHDIAKANEGEHVIIGSDLVRSLGYPEVAEIIAKHGLAHLDEESCKPKTREEKIVFYADKRVINDKLVTIEKRFEYIKQRYKTKNIEKEYKFTKKIEGELVGNDKI